jgi:hypothetical protein
LNNNVTVPHNAGNRLELVHLGHTHLNTGYYDVKLVFETGRVNCDMIFIKKHGSASSEALETDTEFKIIRTDGPHIMPIGGPINSSSQLAKGGENDDNGSWKDRNGSLYSRKQMLNWYKQSIYAYTPALADEELDTYVSEQVEAKVDVIYSHGRGDIDFVNDLEDRAFRHSAGAFSCRALKKLCEAINRNKYAKDNLKIAYFVDNAVFDYIFKQDYPGEIFKYDDPRFSESVWNHMVKPFFDNIPRDMLFEMEPGFVPIQLWTSNANHDYGDVPKGQRKIKEFLVDVSDKCFNEYGFRPAWILSKDYFDNDTRLRDATNSTSNPYIKGVQAWFTWGGAITTMEVCPTNNKRFAFAFNGGRLPFSNCWYNDWNPETNTGTRVSGNTADHHKSALDANGMPAIRPIFNSAIQLNAEWVVLESWSDWAEGSTWYRSNHPEYAYPNQHIALVREFADRTSESIVLEAEGCDEYYNKSAGNKGGAYRVNWYSELDKDFWDSNKDIDLDIYRPLHKLGAFVEQGKPASPTPLTDFAAGNKDVWGMTSAGYVYAHQVDGIPAKNWSGRVTGMLTVKKLALGGGYAWIITADNKVMRAELQRGQTYEHGAFVNITSDATVAPNPQDIALSLKEAWLVDVNGNVYTRNHSGTKKWKQVPGRLKSITAENQSVWGFTPENAIVRMNTESKLRWDTVPNPHNLIKLSGGSSEIWGVNANNEVYRTDASGDGTWQFVASGYNNVGVGLEHVWLSDPEGNMYNCKIDGFEDTTAFPNFDDSNSIETPAMVVRDVHIYPTPFTEELHIDVLTDKATGLNIHIYDLNGKLLSAQTVQTQQGSNYISVDNVSGLNTGVYLLSITSDEYSKTFKVVKTR